MSANLETIRRRLAAHKQDHLLAFHDRLSPDHQRALLAQIDGINFNSIDRLIDQYVIHKPPHEVPADLEPAPYYPLDSRNPARPYDAAAYRRAGEDLIRAGKVAAFTVAGGQGTRLGWNGPKGTFPATVVTGKPLFRIFAEQILAVQKRYSVTVPWYIMTSPLNDADTRAFFADNRFFTLNKRDVFFFQQGVLPSFDSATGTLLLAEKHELAMNPDGHGGSIKALSESGAIEDMRRRGIEHISYFQVDNPLVRAVDPLFIGLHATAPDSSAEMSSKMVAKAYPEEKVGVFCRSQRKTMVIEYSDLPARLAQERDGAGGIRFNAGSIAIHIISRAFVERLTADPSRFALPYHRAEKKVSYVDPSTGNTINPEKPNAVKLETFVFDAIALARSSIVYETSRAEEFAPIKNAEGVDSAASSAQAQSDRHGAWLESRGVKVPRRSDGHFDAKIEISPLTALEAADLPTTGLPREIQPGAEVVL